MCIILISNERNLYTLLDHKERNKIIKKKDTHIIATKKTFEIDVVTIKK